MALSGSLFAVTGGSFWPILGRNNSYCRVLVGFSGTRLAVTNRTAESRWLFLANSWPKQIVLPSLGGSFYGQILGRNKSYCRVSVALSCQLLAVTNRAVALSDELLAVTNRTAESWWLFLANSWP